jgi:DNA polymerase III delta prime subunit
MSRDLFVVSPDERGIIPIERAREISAFLSRTPGISTRKVVIIEDAHRLTDEAESALLKTVEDPPEHSVIMFLTSSPGSLFETIRSRLVGVRFPFELDERVVTNEEAARFTAILESDIAAKLAFAEELADDRFLRARALRHWLVTFGRALHSASDETARRVISRNARLALSAELLLEDFDVNPRFVVEHLLLSFHPLPQ